MSFNGLFSSLNNYDLKKGFLGQKMFNVQVVSL